MNERNMDEQNIIKMLQGDIVVPQTVQDKADEAFEQIRNMSGNQNKRKTRVSGKKILVLAVAAVLALGSITVYAASRNWSRSLSEGMSTTEEQQVQLEQEGAVVFPVQENTVATAQEDEVIMPQETVVTMPQSQTCNGVTITAVQSITDNYAAHLVFKIEGYELPEGKEPSFEDCFVTVDGGIDYNMWGSFYNGLVIGADGRAEYADGSPIDYESGESIARYVQDDGSMEYWITLYYEEKGYFLGKEVHVEFENLGLAGKAEYLSDNEVQGNWSFDWNLQGTDSMRECTFEEPLGDTGAVVTRAEISPITMHVEYQFPYQTRTEQGFDQDGNPISSEMFVEAPPLAGVRLKDGTVYPYLCSGGITGYLEDSADGVYEGIYVNERVITPDQVEYLLFQKRADGSEEVYLTDEFYEVPLNP